MEGSNHNLPPIMDGMDKVVNRINAGPSNNYLAKVGDNLPNKIGTKIHLIKIKAIPLGDNQPNPIMGGQIVSQTITAGEVDGDLLKYLFFFTACESSCLLKIFLCFI